MSEWGFLIDENLETRIATKLRKRGFIAESVRDDLELGTDDPGILAYARENDSAIADLVDDYPDRDSLRYRTPLDPYLD